MRWIIPRFRCFVWIVSFVLIFFPAAAISQTADDLSIHQIQVIGTHNSYHLRPDQASLDLAIAMVPDARSWDYSHLPLNEQLDHGVRSFELDIYAREGQFKVFHVPVIDFHSTCDTLKDCLLTVKDWSDAHPHHVPISFLLELKDQGFSGSAKQSKIDRDYLMALDQEILSVFPPDRVVQPDDVRGDSSTLEEAVTTRGWPGLASCRGKAMFILHVGDPVRRVYIDLYPGLQGAPCFVRSQPGNPEAAVVIHDHPSVDSIQSLVKAGYFVRTRADANLNVNAKDETGRRDNALQSGAHIVSTDFPPGSPRAETGYVCQLPGGVPARANPVTAPQEYANIPLE